MILVVKNLSQKQLVKIECLNFRRIGTRVCEYIVVALGNYLQNDHCKTIPLFDIKRIILIMLNKTLNLVQKNGFLFTRPMIYILNEKE